MVNLRGDQSEDEEPATVDGLGDGLVHSAPDRADANDVVGCFPTWRENLYHMLQSPTTAEIDPVRRDKVSDLARNGYNGDAVPRLRSFLLEQHASTHVRTSTTSGRR